MLQSHLSRLGRRSARPLYQASPQLTRILKLRVIQLGVKTAFHQQALMIALLNNIAVTHHEDNTRILDRLPVFGALYLYTH